MKTKKPTSQGKRVATSVAVAAAEQPTPAGAMTQPVKPDTLLTGASTGGNRTRQWNRWRERYNPLRGLNISRCVTLLEQYQRGEMADPQWAYFFIEQSDADLFAILERREAALLQLDWNIKLVSGRWPKGDRRMESFDEGLAGEQCAALREAYEGIDNLYEAIAHLQLATFRGYAHVEKYRNADGDIFHLELVDQWNMVRDLLRGQWKYNPDALATTFYGISDDNLVDPSNFLIRERDRHVNRIGLLKFIRANLSEKDWDAFIEIYGIPSGVVIGPAGVQPEKEEEYKTSALAISEGGSGYLPNGSQYTPNDLPRGNDPFRPRLDFLTEKLVLAGTGGLLTMLAQSGSGTLAGSAHMEAFDMLARAEARKISEIFQRQFDREILRRHFDGKPMLAYFELAANDELDPDKIADHAQKFGTAGYRIDVAQLSEKSGYDIREEPSVGAGADNEDDGDGLDLEDVPEADGADLSEIANRLAELRELPDEDFGATLARFIASELPVMVGRMITNRECAAIVTRKLSNALLLNNGPADEARDDHGRWSGEGGKSQKMREVGSLRDFFFKLHSDPDAKVEAPIGQIGRNAAGRIRKALGHDVTHVWVSADDYRHVKRLHPEITEADWRNLPETISTATDIRRSVTDRDERAVEIWKKEGSWKLVIGTGRRSAKRLYVRTFKRKGEKQ